MGIMDYMANGIEMERNIYFLRHGDVLHLSPDKISLRILYFELSHAMRQISHMV